jgi:hypothetical protein
MPSIDPLSMRIPVWSSTLIGLGFPLTTLVGITGKRKLHLICTQAITRVELE